MTVATTHSRPFPVLGAEELWLLPSSLLDEQPYRVQEFLALSKCLRIPLGWHYLLDLSWASDRIEALPAGSIVLDAGAGTGLMQWWLADRGMEVVSIDREASYFGRRLRQWCPIVDFHTRRPLSLRRETLRRLWNQPAETLTSPRHLLRTAEALARGNLRPAGRATVAVLQADLADLNAVATHSVDAVVSISSLEHNRPAVLPVVIDELMRVLKPGGSLVATLGAAPSEDWFHVPSSGWCYTEETLRAAFNLDRATASNFAKYADILNELIDCRVLQDNLSEFYFQSGNNGMPWGRWDPQYLSAGIVKTKTS